MNKTIFGWDMPAGCSINDPYFEDLPDDVGSWEELYERIAEAKEQKQIDDYDWDRR